MQEGPSRAQSGERRALSPVSADAWLEERSVKQWEDLAGQEKAGRIFRESRSIFQDLQVRKESRPRPGAGSVEKERERWDGAGWGRALNGRIQGTGLVLETRLWSAALWFSHGLPRTSERNLESEAPLPHSNGC